MDNCLCVLIETSEKYYEYKKSAYIVKTTEARFSDAGHHSNEISKEHDGLEVTVQQLEDDNGF